MADKKKMSVAEILAAARAADGKGTAAPAAPADQPAESAAEPAATTAAEKPAAPKSAPAAKPAAGGARPSVADILAMARAKKEAGDAPAAAPAAKPAAAAKAAPAKPAAAKPAAAVGGPKTGVQRDTASILAAARAGAKPGPVSKADAPTRPAPKPREPKPAEERAAPPRTVATVPPKPVKPAKKGEEAEDRRGFLQIALGSAMALGFTALSVTSGLFTLGLARFMFPNVLAEPPSKFKVGFKDGFPSGKVETKYVPQYGVWVVNGDFNGQQQIYALKTVCTHLGCTPSWLEAEQKFKCPCHGSGFYKDGVNFEGPAPRPLERYAIRIADDGQLEIDKSRTFQEELGQWADPESYVTV
ncbi:MAG: ubiquinol-cytochrome c reductase iron-sulfur subunit [Planctomycetes bacterium]|nr:ubiquinol-cytochrome c reductase iron-sulfur subunit [Planctomycetota bacterium]